jgi:hypothetical protein
MGNMNAIDDPLVRIREALGRMSPSKVRSLSREDFAELLGINPKELSLNHKIKIAKMLYEDFGLSYRWIASRMAMSLRDVSKAVKGNAATKEIIKLAKIDTDTIIKAIKLVREGKVRNPNDLVLELALDLEQAKYLFNTIVENEKVTLLPIIEASQKVEKLWDDIMDHIYGFEELVEYYKERGENIIKELRRALESADEQAKKTMEEILSLQETLKALETRAKDAAKPLKCIQAIEEELQSFREEITSKIATLNDKITELENVEIAKINKDIITLLRGLCMLAHFTGNIIDCLFKLYSAFIPPDKKAIIEELFQRINEGRISERISPKFSLLLRLPIEKLNSEDLGKIIDNIISEEIDMLIRNITNVNSQKSKSQQSTSE